MTRMIEAFDSAMASMQRENIALEQDAVTAHYCNLELKRLMNMMVAEIQDLPDYDSWLCFADIDWKGMKDNNFYDEIGEDALLVAMYLEQKGR